MSVNLVMIDGNITREPTTSVDGGYARWSASLAHSEVRWNNETRAEVVYTNWIFLTAQGDVAEDLINRGVGKGSKLLVRGSIGTYVKEDGNGKETKTQVKVLGFDIIRGASQGGYQHQTQQQDPNAGWGSQGNDPSAGWGGAGQQQQQQQYTKEGGWNNPPAGQQGGWNGPGA